MAPLLVRPEAGFGGPSVRRAISRPAARVKSGRAGTTELLARGNGFRVVPETMDEGRLSLALDRAERAIVRIAQSLDRQRRSASTEETLRKQVREVVTELDEIIRMAEAQG